MGDESILLRMIESLKSSIEKFKKAGLSLGSLKTLLTSIVKAVEEFNSEAFQGEDKKKAALDLLEEVYVLSGIDIPFVPNSWERRILRCFAGLIIDSVVSELNKRGWDK